MGLSAEYVVNGVSVDTDLLNHDEYSWNYFKTFDGDWGSTTASEWGIAPPGCGGTFNYCP